MTYYAVVTFYPQPISMGLLGTFYNYRPPMVVDLEAHSQDEARLYAFGGLNPWRSVVASVEILTYAELKDKPDLLKQIEV